MKYRKKPTIIEAFRYGREVPPSWFTEKTKSDSYYGKPQIGIGIECCHIQTLEGVMTAQIGDFIIKGIKGEIYPCKPDIFEATYEVAEGEGK